MTQEIRKDFHGNLEKVEAGIVRMAAVVTESIPRATSALLNGDLEAAQVLIDGDDALDELSVELEEECYRLLALEGPVAGDLRAVTTALRMNQEIERAGDLATNVAKATRRIYGRSIDPKVRGILVEMSDESARLLKLSIDSYAEGQTGLAAAIDDMDDRLDELNYALVEALLKLYSEPSRDIGSAVQLALVGRYFERIGDHAVNIGERVRYMVDGWLPEHTGAARAAVLRGSARARGATVETGQLARAGDDGSILEKALENLDQGIVLADTAGAIVYQNGAAQRFVRARHGGALVEGAIEELLNAARNAQTLTREVEWFGPPKQVFAVSTRPLTAGDGTAAGAMALVIDLSEIRSLEEVRKDFVANVSHELKTPAAALSLLAETLTAEDSPDIARKLASRLRVEATRLTSTIDDLLQLSRIEHEEHSVREEVSVVAAVRSALDGVQQAAAQRAIDLQVTTPDNSPVVSADPTQVSSAVFNLLDNAVKHSDPGSAVRLEVLPLSGTVEIRVADSGPGIPRDDLDRIFERFYRIDRPRTRNTGGTGLGLSIVRHIMANHGGAVRVDSTEGEGAAFTLTFPLSESSPQ